MSYSSKPGRPRPNPYLLQLRRALASGVGPVAVSIVIPRLLEDPTPASVHAHKVITRWLLLIDMGA